MGLSSEQVPYTGPYSISGNGRHSGPTAEALKRAMKRAQFGFASKDLDELNDVYNQDLEGALDRFDPGGQNGYGDGRWKKIRELKCPPGSPHAGEWALDDYARDLIKNEAKKPPPSSKPTFKEALTSFCEQAINEPWNYSQNRAIDVDVDPNADNNNSDCSGSTIQAFHYAKKKSGQNVPDPSKYNYTGYGNTWDDEDGHPKVTNGQYKVGDLAHYDGHVTVCYHAGNADTADWFSFGSEPPSKRKLYYRSDFKFVVRPPMSPSPDTFSTTFERLTAWLRFWRVQRYVLFWKNGKRRGDPPTD